MAIIKCRHEDGTLAPSTIEFELGDTIQFESHQPVYVLAGSSVATQALRSFHLNEISVQAEDGSVLVGIPDLEAGPNALVSHPRPAPIPSPPPPLADPRLPPPGGGADVSPIPRPIKVILAPPTTNAPAGPL
jgi:hypothetical protein